MTEIDDTLLHRTLVDCRDMTHDVLENLGIRIYRYQDWLDAERKYDEYEDLLMEDFHGP